MKKFEKPRLTVVHLLNEDISTTASGCGSKMCYGFDCPDCPTICPGIYHCEVFKCQQYEN